MSSPDLTFCKIPFCPEITEGSADIAVFGAPHGTPYKPGVASHAANAPKAIREALSWHSVGHNQFDFDTMKTLFNNHKVVDCGNIDFNLKSGKVNRRAIYQKTREILFSGAVPIVFGGDDSIPIPFIQSYEGIQKNLCIIQIDAHIDWRDEINGIKQGYSSTMRRVSEMPHVETIIQIGARGPGSAYQQDLNDAKEWGVHFFTGRDIHKNGIQPIFDCIPEQANVILTIDVDGLDPSYMPGVILPAFGGLSYQHMLDLIEGISNKAKIAGADFVEYVPEKDPALIGATMIARLACVLISWV